MRRLAAVLAHWRDELAWRLLVGGARYGLPLLCGAILGFVLMDILFSDALHRALGKTR